MPTPKSAKKPSVKAKSKTSPTKSKPAKKSPPKAKTATAKKVVKTPAKTTKSKATVKKQTPKAKVPTKKTATKVVGKKVTASSSVKPKPASKKSTTKSKPLVKEIVGTAKKKVSAKEAAKAVSKTAEPHALKNEITDKVRTLIHLSREQGFLTFKDIDKSLPEIATDPEELQNVISIFNNLEIKLLDSAEVEKFKKNKEEKEDESARSNQSDMLDDPVRMYLKQMGQVPLLSREEEVEISKRIEVAEIAALKRIYSVSLTASFHLEICQKLIDREERFDRVVLDKKIDSRRLTSNFWPSR